MSNTAKRYYWLKLKEDFFEQRVIKKLRKIAGGDTYTIIYLKLQLLAMKNEGKLFFEGIEEDFSSEMALELDEDEENVKVTLMYLEKNKLIETVAQDEFLLPEVLNVIGSENASAMRVRKHREEKKVLQCNTDVTPLKHFCNVEIDIEKEREKEKEKELDNKNNNSSSSMSDIASAIRQEIKLIIATRKISVDSIIRNCNDIKRIKEVFEYANKMFKEDSWIIACLRDKYDLTKQKQQFKSTAEELLERIERGEVS